MTEVTALSIVQKLETAVGRFQVTGDKSSLKGSFSWAKGAAAKLDNGEQELIEEETFEDVLPDEVVVEEEESDSFFLDDEEEGDED